MHPHTHAHTPYGEAVAGTVAAVGTVGRVVVAAATTAVRTGEERRGGVWRGGSEAGGTWGGWWRARVHVSVCACAEEEACARLGQVACACVG